MELLLEDPLTKHSFDKPRGYPGDASLLDIVYLESEALQKSGHASEVGQGIFQYLINVPASRAVRNRREVLAQEIDSTISRNPQCRILSVACGHLRELGLTRACEERSFGEFVAFDQDMLSLKTVEQTWRNCGVHPLKGNVVSLLKGKRKWKPFDLIYAAGLYDYLVSSTAARLTAKLFDLLDVRGTLVIANFLPNIQESGYMEAVMDWWLIQRSFGEMAAFMAEIPESDVLCHTITTDPHTRIGYLKVIKK
jgi:hypothetical protein